jgi:sugar/nucleoside kinase (ribokinase family)
MTPDFLVAGHLVQDLLPDGSWRLGGAAAYASLLARNLGLRTAVLTACSDEIDTDILLQGIHVYRVRSAHTTQMRNIYPPEASSRREQWVPQRASRITAEDLPPDWREARIVLLGPVAGELDDSLALAFAPWSLIGAGAQGWLREVRPDQRVQPVHPDDWESYATLRRTSALFLSDEDLPPAGPDARPPALDGWCQNLQVVAFTRGYQGADVCHRGEWRHIDAFPSSADELTGAGDTFAAAFLIRYNERGDPWDAARFASAAASIVIEGVGVEGVPQSTSAIEARMRS